ncbi:hypothetical protein F2Q69_00011038 [Brassica cretica]|uniref:Uncharacterized protein n=1 Tax=Brassica cretica TaxID=69181 RepID=A0A8S9R322_BRACR|nr:hypothetical protein F2Q69_00011038 [Brassica cretica]
MIDEETDHYHHHGERGSFSGVACPFTACNSKSGCGSVAKSSAPEQVSASGTSSESSAAQGSVCGSNVMAPTSWPEVVPSMTPPPSLAPTLPKALALHKAPSLAPTPRPSLAPTPVQSPTLVNRMSLSPFRVFNMLPSIVNSVYVLRYDTFMYGSVL